MLDRMKELEEKVRQLYQTALESNPNNIDGEIALLYEIHLIMKTMLKVGPEERMTKIRRLVPKIREGLSISQEGQVIR